MSNNAMITKFNTMEVGTAFASHPFAVKAAEIKKTKGGKDYLYITLFDGVTSLSGNMWDFVGPVPGVNTIQLVTGKIGEWAGNKQVTVSKLEDTTNYTIADFAPQGDFSVDLYWSNAMCLINKIEDAELSEFVRVIYTDFEDKLKVAPSAKSVHNAYVGGNLEHLVDVTMLAVSMCHNYPMINTDVVIAGALLHDIGKVFEYTIDGVNINTTIDGHLLYHIPMGMTIVDRYRGTIPNAQLKLLQHIILSHHGQKEYGSPVEPKCMEAVVVHFADMLDAQLGALKEANKVAKGSLTDKIWTLGNKQYITQAHVEAIMGNI